MEQLEVCQCEPLGEGEAADLTTQVVSTTQITCKELDSTECLFLFDVQVACERPLRRTEEDAESEVLWRHVLRSPLPVGSSADEHSFSQPEEWL